MEIFNYTLADLAELFSKLTLGEWMFIAVCIGFMMFVYGVMQS